MMLFQFYSCRCLIYGDNMNQPQTIQVSDKEYQALVKRVERLEKS